MSTTHALIAASAGDAVVSVTPAPGSPTAASTAPRIQRAARPM